MEKLYVLGTKRIRAALISCFERKLMMEVAKCLRVITWLGAHRNKELQRMQRFPLHSLDGKGVIKTFPVRLAS